jgi:hypothetical protein
MTSLRIPGENSLKPSFFPAMHQFFTAGPDERVQRGIDMIMSAVLVALAQAGNGTIALLLP